MNNPLGGSIPSSFGKLVNLKELSLAHTQITGSLPDGIESLDSFLSAGFKTMSLSILGTKLRRDPVQVQDDDSQEHGFCYILHGFGMLESYSSATPPPPPALPPG